MNNENNTDKSLKQFSQEDIDRMNNEMWNSYAPMITIDDLPMSNSNYRKAKELFNLINDLENKKSLTKEEYLILLEALEKIDSFFERLTSNYSKDTGEKFQSYELEYGSLPSPDSKYSKSLTYNGTYDDGYEYKPCSEDIPLDYLINQEEFLDNLKREKIVKEKEEQAKIEAKRQKDIETEKNLLKKLQKKYGDNNEE